MTDLSLIYVAGLALVDAINPCALAVMGMVLMALLLNDPTNKKRVLLGGLAFTTAVFILYFFYGLLMISVFSSFIPETGLISFYVFRGFGLLAILLGLLNIKDWMKYGPGAFATEMPLKMRPRLRQIIHKISSPWGAFGIGIFVTLFLLPCTIGPYLIASGKLSALALIETVPWLLIYNLIFILPMIGVTLAIYFGVSTVDKVSGWKEKNIRKLHLWEGIVLILLGIVMFTGLI
jgi:cytochrome c biogenesis protein CcdA